MPKTKSLIEFLQEKKLLSEKDVKALTQEAKERGVLLEDVLVERKLVDEEKLAETKSELFGVPAKFFAKDETIPQEVVALIPDDSARTYGMFAFAKEGDVVSVGMVHPEDPRAQEALKFIAQKLNLTLKIFVITRDDFNRLIQGYFAFGEEMQKAIEAVTRQYVPDEEQTSQHRLVEIDAALTQVVREEAPIIRMVALFLRQAVVERASDIHVEPEQNRLRVRLRIDGDLQIKLSLPLEVQSAVVARIKIMSNLKIDETRVPQDGRFRTLIDGREVDFRVSTFPTAAGEKVAIRVLDPTAGLKELSGVGFHPWNEKIVREGIRKPFGMILATGPTGSGKTTTLYAILQILNQEDTNVVTLEDPIEYLVPGMNQSQVVPEIGYTFAGGLRAIVRQDPDVIMVGEVRDSETAELAVHAALTGHVVLSTLHTNNAIGTVPRLTDLGVKPFLLPSALNLAMSQRLARRLCPDCKKTVKATGDLEKTIEQALSTLPPQLAATETYPRPYTTWITEGCATCNHKGVVGRVAVHEVLRMTRELERIILGGFSEEKFSEEAARQGMITMRQDGILKALKGDVSIQEVIQETA
ncbi:MAG: Flp pilus assembly complex ATPase component TadA [Parcubacteria group bacterium]|nr:Flp pilus assembly complex ATPase component TadA [Parcubacteria group bacterium]